MIRILCLVVPVVTYLLIDQPLPTWCFSSSAAFSTTGIHRMPMTTTSPTGLAQFGVTPFTPTPYYTPSNVNNMAMYDGDSGDPDFVTNKNDFNEVLDVVESIKDDDNVDEAAVTGIHPWFKELTQRNRQEVLAHAAAALVFMSAILVPFQQDAAWAAPSGGRMGGGGGFSSSRGYSRSFASPASRLSSPSVYSNRGFTQGYSNGYLSRGPPATIARFGTPRISPFYYGGFNPLFVPRPAPIFGMPMLFRGPGLFFGGLGLLPFAMFSWFMLQALSSVASLGNKRDVSAGSRTIFGQQNQMKNNNMFRQRERSFVGDGVTTVAQISIALDIPNRDDPSNILNYLNRLSKSSNTNSRQGIANLVNQVALELLRQKDSIFASNTSQKNFNNLVEAQRTYEKVVVNERSKFERETTGTGGEGANPWKDLAAGYGGAAGRAGTKATSAVITLIVALDHDGTSSANFPTIHSASDVEKALAQMASDVKLNNSLRSAEILWTPGQREDVLTRQVVFMDYPNLRNI